VEPTDFKNVIVENIPPALSLYRLDGRKGAFSWGKGLCKGHKKRCKGHVQGPQIR
jgi:hypothetical protein